MLKRIIAALTVCAALLLTVLLVFTTPAGAGPLGILCFFILLYTVALGVLTFLFFGIGKLAARPRIKAIMRKRSNPVSFQASYYYASVAALAPVMFVALQSVDHVGFYQFLLVVAFLVLAWIYVSKRTI